jgi:hypothetical protein
MENIVRQLPPDVHEFAVIFDLEGWTLTKTDRKLIATGLDWLQRYYPHRLSYACFVNVPWYLSVVWRFVGPLLHEPTRSRLRFLKSCDELKQSFADDQLPVENGGVLELRNVEPFA